MNYLLGTGLLIVGALIVYGGMTGRLAAMIAALVGQGQATSGASPYSIPLIVA